jgi:hypothetical protein
VQLSLQTLALPIDISRRFSYFYSLRAWAGSAAPQVMGAPFNHSEAEDR